MIPRPFFTITLTRSLLRLLPLAALALLAAACGGGSAGGGDAPRTLPADFAVRYEWGNGALPPPHHYDYTVHLGPGASTGRVEFRPGHDSVPVWKETFPVTEAQLRSVYAVFMARGVFDRAWSEGQPMAGGETEWLEATADGRSVTLPSQPRGEDRQALREVYAAVRAVVPDGVIAGLVARQERFQEQQGASGGAPASVPPASSPDSVPGPPACAASFPGAPGEDGRRSGKMPRGRRFAAAPPVCFSPPRRADLQPRLPNEAFHTLELTKVRRDG